MSEEEGDPCRRIKSSCERPLLTLTPIVSSCVEQKDSHTVYLEQELDSLKVVLDMKNQQLHQKDKKLLEMDRLVGTRTLCFWSRALEDSPSHGSGLCFRWRPT